MHTEPNRICLLFCNNFSSAGDSSFILPELAAWVKAVDQVIIFSVHFSPNRPELPNIELVDLNIPESWKVPFITFVFYSFRLIFQKRFWIELFDIFRFAPGLKNVYCAVSKYAYQKQAEKKVLRYLSRHPEYCENEFILYSFWMDYIAGLAAEFPVPGKVLKRICRAHGYDLYEDQPGNGYMPWRRDRITKLDHVYTASKAGADFLKGRFPSLQDKISCAYLGSYDFGLQPYIPSGTLRLISCALLTPVKQIEKLIEALSHIKDIAVKWTHIGSGPDEAKLKLLAQKILPENIQCDWRGYCFHEQVKTIYQTECFDLFVSVSASEGLPVSVMEALSAGIPVVSTAVGGVPEIVIPGQTGWLLDSDLVEWPDIVKRYVALSLTERMAFRERVRHFWEDRFSAEKNATSFVQRVSQ